MRQKEDKFFYHECNLLKSKMNFEFIVLVLMFTTTAVGTFPDCAEYLVSGQPGVTDSQLTSTSNDENEASNARLTGNGWCPSFAEEEPYIQVKFNGLSTVIGFVTESVEHIAYSVKHSTDGSTWKIVKEKQIFTGNKDVNTLKFNKFQQPLLTRSIRIHPQSSGCLRFDVLGCKDHDSETCFDYLISGAEDVQDIKLSKVSYSSQQSYSVLLNTVILNSTSMNWCSYLFRYYIQVDFNQVVNVTGIVTQGGRQFSLQYNMKNSWVENYTVEYHYIDSGYKYIQDKENKVFYNFYKRPTLARLENPIELSFLRIYPRITQSASVCIKFDVLGCRRNGNSQCNSFLVSSTDEVPDYKLKASSQLSEDHSPRYARLSSTEKGNWCPNKFSSCYIQVELNTLSYVVGIATQGRHLSGNWVTKYFVQHSMDGDEWTFIEQSNGAKLEFLGNFDSSTTIINTFKDEVKAKFIRILPAGYNKYPCLRFDVLGCYASQKEDWTLQVLMNALPKLFIGIEGNDGYKSVSSDRDDLLNTNINAAIGEPYMIVVRNLIPDVEINLRQVTLVSKTTNKRFEFVCNCLLSNETRTIRVSGQGTSLIGVKTGNSSPMSTMGRVTIVIKGKRDFKYELEGIFTNGTYDTFPISISITGRPQNITIKHESVFKDFWFLEYVSIYHDSSEVKSFCNCWFHPQEERYIDYGNAERKPEPMPQPSEMTGLETTHSDNLFYIQTTTEENSQNRNRNVALALFNAVSTLENIEVIDQKYLEPGHTEMECDSMRAAIETAKKRTSIYVPSQWDTIIRMARKRVPYTVIPLKHPDFRNYKSVASKCLPAALSDKRGKKVKWMSMKWIQFRKREPNTIYFKYGYDEEEFNCLNLRSSSRKSQFHHSSMILQCYKNKLPISSTKKSDLVSLCDDGTIPEEYHSYYKNLPCCVSLQDKIPEPDLLDEVEDTDEEN